MLSQSVVSDSATAWTVPCQGPRIFQASIWCGLPFPSPEDLPHPGIKPMSLVSPALAGGFFTTVATF